MKRNILIVILAVLLVTALAKDKVIEVSVEQICTFILGAKLDIGSMKVGVFRPVLKIKDMKLYNPEGFPDKLMADIPEIYLRYEFPPTFHRSAHIKDFKFYLRELDITRNRDGKVNLDSLKPVAEKESGEALEKKEQGRIPDIRIDRLHLKADKVVYRDYSKGPDPAVKTFDVGLDESYEDIEDPYTLVRLIIVRVLADTAVSQMISVPMEGVSNVMKKATEVGKEAVKAGETAAKKTVESAGTIVKNTGGVLEKTASGIGNVLKSPFSASDKTEEQK